MTTPCDNTGGFESLRRLQEVIDDMNSSVSAAGLCSSIERVQDAIDSISKQYEGIETALIDFSELYTPPAYLSEIEPLLETLSNSVTPIETILEPQIAEILNSTSLIPALELSVPAVEISENLQTALTALANSMNSIDNSNQFIQNIFQVSEENASLIQAATCSRADSTEEPDKKYFDLSKLKDSKVLRIAVIAVINLLLNLISAALIATFSSTSLDPVVRQGLAVFIQNANETIIQLLSSHDLD